MTALPLTHEAPAPSRAWRRLRRHPGAILGGGMVAVFVVAALAAPLVAP